MASYQPTHIRPKRPPQHFRPTHPQHAKFAPPVRPHLSLRAKALGFGTITVGTGAIVAVMSTGGAQVVENSPSSHHPATTTTVMRDIPRRPEVNHSLKR
jgi:hypothetical protein